MELFFTGDPAGRHDVAHTVCNSCKQKKAIMVMLGGQEMKKLIQHVGGVVQEESYIKAIAKVEDSIKRLTNQATSKLFCNVVENGDALEQPRLEVEERGKMVAI